MRLLLLIGLCIVGYYMLRRIISDQFSNKTPYGDRTASDPRHNRYGTHLPPPSDELVKDPICGIYFPKKEAYAVKMDGKMYYFCSNECRDRFIEQINQQEGTKK